jgi:hypothetical protein
MCQGLSNVSRIVSSAVHLKQTYLTSRVTKFVHWAIDYFGQFLENYRSSPKAQRLLYYGINYALILQRTCWASFWVIFFTDSSGQPADKLHELAVYVDSSLVDRPWETFWITYIPFIHPYIIHFNYIPFIHFHTFMRFELHTYHSYIFIHIFITYHSYIFIQIQGFWITAFSLSFSAKWFANL